MDSGATIPVTHTSTAVQIDEVLTALQSPTRADLSRLLEGCGTALTHQPTAAEDATQLPEVQGKTGAEALNGALKYGGDAGRYSSQVTNALLGTQQRDLSRLVAGAGRTFGALASREADLQGLIDNFNVFTGALATQSTNLSTTVKLLGPDPEHRPRLAGQPQPHPAAAAHLRDRADPGRGRAAGPDQRLETMAWPRSARCSPAKRAAASPGCSPNRRRASPARLRRARKRPCPQLNQLSLCTTKVLVPTVNQTINDRFSTGGPNYREFLYNLANFAGQAQNFDGNGPYAPHPGWRRRPAGRRLRAGSKQDTDQRPGQLRPHGRRRRSAPSHSSAACRR